MEVVFSGICLWEKESRAPGLLGLMPNATGGHTHGGVTISPHTACVLAREGEVDLANSNWPNAPTPVTVYGGPHLLFTLNGDEISFEPLPIGGPPILTGLKRPRDISEQTHAVKPSLTGNAPQVNEVVARVHLPNTASLHVTPNAHGANFTTLTVSDDTELIGTSFGGTERRLKFTGVNPSVIVANIDIIGAQSGNTADDDHGDLYFGLFDPLQESAAKHVHAASPRVAAATAATHVIARFQQEQSRLGDQLTIGPGCSNSQFP